MIKIVGLLIVALCLFGMTWPLPYDLKVGKSTLQDIQANYHIEYSGERKCSGSLYQLDASQFDIVGLKAVVFVFVRKNYDNENRVVNSDSQQKILAEMSWVFTNKDYDRLLNLIKKNHRVNRIRIPGWQRSVEYIDKCVKFTLKSTKYAKSTILTIEKLNSELCD